MLDSLVDGVSRFRTEIFPAQRSLYQRLASQGQSPKALVVSCSDSRVIPEIFTGADPGDIFVTRNAGNIVPPFAPGSADAVTSAIEFAVAGLKVDHIIVCGHSDCGAMKGVLNPSAVSEMPQVAAWLGHCGCALHAFRRTHGESMSNADAARLLAMENVAAQLVNLRTHPSVAGRLAEGTLTLHGWLFDIASGTVHALDGATRRFRLLGEDADLPVALAAQPPRPQLVAAE